MALINKDAALREALKIVNNCPPGSGVELLSYKRNRTIALIRCPENSVLMREKGYLENEQKLSLPELPKILKGSINREFPRSRKIRFFKFSTVDALERQRQKI